MDASEMWLIALFRIWC